MLEIFNELHRLTGLSASGVWWAVTRGLPKGRCSRVRTPMAGPGELTIKLHNL